METFAKSVRLLFHPRTATLLRDFLAVKLEHGSGPEVAVYKALGSVDDGSAVTGLVDRLIRKRPLAFLTGADSYLLRTGRRGRGGFDAVGTDAEMALRLEELQSYDEMALSALMGVSCHTHFINAGSRQNIGRPAPSGTFTPTGVYVSVNVVRFVWFMHCLTRCVLVVLLLLLLLLLLFRLVWLGPDSSGTIAWSGSTWW